MGAQAFSPGPWIRDALYDVVPGGGTSLLTAAAWPLVWSEERKENNAKCQKMRPRSASWQKCSKVGTYWSMWCKQRRAEGANKNVMDVSVLLSPSTHVNAVSASSPKVTCVSLGLSSWLRAPSLACRPSQQPCRPQLTVRTASSSDREEARPAATKRQDRWRQTEGWRNRKGREKKKRPSSRGVS